MAIAGELLQNASMPTGGQIRTSDTIADGVVIVERKTWTAPLGIQGQWVDGAWRDDYAIRPARAETTQSHVQDTWWVSSHTHDCLGGGWTEYVYNMANRTIAARPIGPIEKPRRGPAWDAGRPIVRCLLDGATWDNINPRGIYPEGDRRFRPLDGPDEITMSLGLLQIDVTEFISNPWYVAALQD